MPAINQQWIIDYYRSHDVDGSLEDLTDQEIFLGAIEHVPGLFEAIPTASKGEQYYEKDKTGGISNFERIGDELKRLTTRNIPTGFSGAILGKHDEVNAKREYHNAMQAAIFEASPEYHASAIWNQEEEGWTSLDTALRSFSQVVPSLAVSIVSAVGSTAAGTVAGAAVGGGVPGAVVGFTSSVATLIPVFLMETGGQYEEIQAMMVDDYGMSPEEASDYAQSGSLVYGAMSTGLELLGARHFIRTANWLGAGLRGGEVYHRTLTNALMDKMVHYGVDKNALIKGVTKFGAGTVQGLSQAMIEGLTEGAQSLTGLVIKRGMELGISDNPADILSRYEQAFKESWLSKPMLEEAFAGATTGILGLAGGSMYSVDKANEAAMDRLSKMVDAGVYDSIMKGNEPSTESKIKDGTLNDYDGVGQEIVDTEIKETDGTFDIFLKAVLNPKENQNALEENLSGKKMNYLIRLKIL